MAYLVLALVLWSGVWLHHPTSTATCGCGDTSLLTWFMAWPAYALRHGQSLIFSTRALHPDGINLPANTSFLAISVPLAPVTWLFGPVASLNVAATLAPVASALSARALLLRWTTWAPAAFLAGLFYGFSPFVIENLSLQHVEFATQVVPPLLFLCLDELLVRQRGRAWTWGLAIAGLCTLQFFISSEVLVDCVLAAAIGTVVLVIAGLLRDATAVTRRVTHAVTGLATAAGAGVVLLAYPAWYAVAGPRALPSSVWPAIEYFGNAWRTLFLPADAHDRGPNAILETYGYFGSHPLLLGYLGIGMAVVLVIGLVWFRTDRRLWFCAALLVTLEGMSLGAAAWPWRLFDHLPLIKNAVPDRIAGVSDLFAAVMFGVILDRARASGSTRTPGRHRPRSGTLVAYGLAAVALLPFAFGYRLPFTTRPVDVPPWFTAIGTTLPTSAVVLTYPYASSGLRAPMTWQAVGGLRWSLAGGESITPNPPSHPSARQRAVAVASVDLDNLSDGFWPLPTGRPDQVARLRLALHDWGVTTVVVPAESGWPASLQGRSVPVAVATFAVALGTAPRFEDGAWVWQVPTRPTPVVAVSQADFVACTTSPATALDPGRAASCVLGDT